MIILRNVTLIGLFLFVLVYSVRLLLSMRYQIKKNPLWYEVTPITLTWRKVLCVIYHDSDMWFLIKLLMGLWILTFISLAAVYFINI
jgi:hypothetical protein